MAITVWFEGWQMECCGDPFAIGDAVTWTVTAADSEWLERMLGSEHARTIEWAEDHHDLLPEGAESLTGTVTAIRIVNCRYEPRPGSGGTLYEAPGSATFTNIRSTARPGETPPGRRLLGYVVELAATR